MTDVSLSRRPLGAFGVPALRLALRLTVRAAFGGGGCRLGKSLARAVAVVALAGSVAGCVDGVASDSRGKTVSRSAAAFLGGEILVDPPRGYCVDPAASRDSSDNAVIVVNRCAKNTHDVPAVITITLGERGSAEVLKSGAKALSDYFTSPVGRAALARDGSAASVVVRQTSLAGGVLVMKMVDRAVGEYWRAVLSLKGRLVTVAVTAPETSSLSADQSRALLDQVLAGLRKANGSVIRAASGAAN
ncbi:hypothetical protein HOY34_04740 [Xinfangfangia sp. D13-10-4-6]|nr:hypothetical protein [Pseudogemmobacter hezensis]